ncbi:MAG: hypothetical protein RL167_924 [Actinomycetota bacterium]
MSVANWKPQKSDLSERLLHLTCALLSAPYGLDKYEIYNAIKGYRDSLEAGDDSQSIDRKFERDKKSLREMGVLVESYIPASAMENNLETRYRISSDAFLWPKDVVLSPRQLSLLKLAAQAWAHASLSDDASRALNRLRALGISSDDSGLIGLVPRIRTHEPSFFALSEAIDLGKSVSFSYRKPGQEVAEDRSVFPWSLQNIDGQWLLMGWDFVREEPRNFLLKRIVSKIQFDDDEYEKPAPEHLEKALRDLEELVEKQIATIRLKPDSEAWIHFNGGSGQSDSDIKIHYQDLHLLAEELRDYGADVTVLSPIELVKEVRRGFEQVASDHA